MRFHDLKLRLIATLGRNALLLADCQNGDITVHPVATGETGSRRLDYPGGVLRGEEASLQRAAMEKLIQDYTAVCSGTAIGHTTSGSDAGVKTFFGGAADLVGPDSLFSRKRRGGVIETDRAEKCCRENTALNLPMIPGPVTVACNVGGASDLNLTAELVARIFTDSITRWSDPVIMAANPGISFSDTGVVVFHRADESGTTGNLMKYLAKTAGNTWEYDASKKWPAPRGKGKEKATGVADAVADTRSSITYLERGAALERDPKLARIDGVELPEETAGWAVAVTGVETDGDDIHLGIDYTPGGGTYPLVMATYEVICSTGGSNPGLLRDFPGLFASGTTQVPLEELGYAPPPNELRKKVSRSVSGIR